MKKNTIVTIVVAAMVAASLSACGAKNEAPAETPAVVEEVTAEVTPEVVEEEVTPEVEEVAEEVTPEVEEETPVEEEEEGLMLPGTNLKFKSLKGCEPVVNSAGDGILYESADHTIVYSLSVVPVGDVTATEQFFVEYNKEGEEILGTPVIVDKPCTAIDVEGSAAYLQIVHTDIDGCVESTYHMLKNVGLDNYVLIEYFDQAYTDDMDKAVSLCEETILADPYTLEDDAK